MSIWRTTAYMSNNTIDRGGMVSEVTIVMNSRSLVLGGRWQKVMWSQNKSMIQRNVRPAMTPYHRSLSVLGWLVLGSDRVCPWPRKEACGKDTDLADIFGSCERSGLASMWSNRVPSGILSDRYPSELIFYLWCLRRICGGRCRGTYIDRTKCDEQIKIIDGE